MTSEQTAFLKWLVPLAISDMKRVRVLASLTIAQAIVESDWGRSELAVKANNLFGIKANSEWTGKIYNKLTG